MGVVTVLVLGAVGSIILVSRATFFADDFIGFSVARQQGLTGSYLLLGVYGHLIPMFRLANWALVTWAPYRWWPAAAVEVTLYLAGIALTWRLLRLLFGASWGAVVVLGVAALSLLYVPTILWWSSAGCLLPLFAASALTVDAFVRYDMTHKVRHLAVLTLAYAVGLGFFDSMLLNVIVLVLFTALFLCAGSGFWGAARGVARRWPAWLCLAVPTGLDLAYRFAHSAEFTAPVRPTLRELVHYLAIAWSQAFVPGSLGLRYPELVSNVTAVTVVGQVAFVLVVGVSLRRRPQAWRAWVLFALVIGILLVITGENRVGVFGPGLGLDYRYLASLPIVSALTLGLAFLPLRAVVAPDGARVTAPVGPAPVAARPEDDPVARPAGRSAGRVAVAGLTALAVGAYLLAAGISTERIATTSESWLTAGYIQRFTASQVRVQASDPQAFLYNDAAPFVPPAFFPYNLYSYTLAKVAPGLPFNRTQGRGYVAGVGGALVPAVLTADPGEVSSPGVTATGGSLVRVFGAVCDVTTAPSQLTVPLARGVPATVEFLRFRYAVNRPAVVDVSTGTGAAAGPAIEGQPALTLAAGSGWRLENLFPRPTASLVFAVPADRTFCLSDLDVGVPVAAGG